MIASAQSLWPWHHYAKLRPEAIALSTADGDWSWLQLAQQVHEYRICLADHGMQAGDVLMWVGKNHLDAVMYYLAALELHIVTAFCMPQSEHELREKMARLYQAQQTVYVAGQLPDSMSQTPTIRRVTFEPSSRNDAVVHTPHASTNILLRDDHALATLVFTSGSTGVPKAVAHTFAQHLASAQGLLSQLAFTAQDSWLLSLPLYHVSGLAIIHRWLSVGARLQLGKGGSLSEDLQGATHASLVPTQLQRLLTSEHQLSLSHVLLGGSQIPHSLASEAAQRGIDTWVGYGMTEAASTVVAKQLDAIPSAGRVLPKRAIKLEGERIWIGGETLASGYYHQGQLTPLVNEQGWFDSKDLGQLQNGELFIIGRADNQFISGGENIHCEEIEAALLAHPHIHQAMVIPVQDEQYGARPVALIDGSADVLSDLPSLRVWLGERLVKFKIPQAFLPLPQLDSQAGIKLSRAALKQWLEQHTDYQVMA